MTMTSSTDNQSGKPGLTRGPKEKYFNQKGRVIWFTGLSGSGKTTLATLLANRLAGLGFFCQVLDGDIIRKGISRNLGFSEDDRAENIRRVAEMARILLDNGIVVICAFISPTAHIRKMAQEIIGNPDYLEIFVNTPVRICEQRDPKGLYKKARAGEIPHFTGISSPFEIPVDPFLTVDNSTAPAETAIFQIMEKILPEITPREPGI